MLLRVSVAEASSGLCLFDKVYKWKSESRATQLCTLMAVFYQFAREIDNGSISQVLFQRSAPVKAHRGNTSSRRLDPPPAAGKANDVLAMATTRNDAVLVGVFHDTVSGATEVLMKELASRVLQRFTQQFEAQLSAHAADFKLFSEEKTKGEVDVTAVQADFASFESEVEALRKDVLESRSS